MVRVWSIMVLLLLAALPSVVAECWLGVYCELFGEADLSSLEATRAIGGSWGGYGDMGEAEVRLTLSWRRGDERYSVLCDAGEGSG
jgi:hypothetical protein